MAADGIRTPQRFIGSRSRSRHRSRALLFTSIALVPPLLAGAGGQWYRSRNARVPLLSAGVVIDPSGRLVGVAPGQSPPDLLDGTRVLANGALSADAGRAFQKQRAALSASRLLPFAKKYHGLLATSIVDLETLLLPNGAAISGWPSAWRYVWPRDAAFIAVALAHNGQYEQSLQVLRFLQGVQPGSGTFEARYLPDGSGPPDGRGEESDGAGLVLWATREVMDWAPSSQRRSIFAQLSPLISRSASSVYRLTSTSSALPPASKDYWEVQDERLSLGTAAPMLVGLDAASEIYSSVREFELSARCRERADRVSSAIDKAFGSTGYGRYLGDDSPDASLAFLLPPFTDRVKPHVLSAWQKAVGHMRRPSGGLAPGAGWKEDGISWTAETALFALTAASVGQRSAAAGWLDWLADHETRLGALPEKVLSNGAPAGPAPLAFTDAIVILAIEAYDSGSGSI